MTVKKHGKQSDVFFDSGDEAGSDDTTLNGHPAASKLARAALSRVTDNRKAVGSTVKEYSIVRSTSMIDLQPIGAAAVGYSKLGTTKNSGNLESGQLLRPVDREIAPSKQRILITLLAVSLLILLFSTTVLFFMRYSAAADSLSILKDAYGDPEAIVHAGRVISMMDRSIDPCDDFYSYACNQYVESNYVPSPISGESGVFTELENARIGRLTQLLEGNYLDRFEADLFQKEPDLRQIHLMISKYFETCRSATPYSATLLEDGQTGSNATMKRFLESSLNATIYIDRYIQERIGALSPKDPAFLSTLTAEMFALSPQTLAQYRGIDALAEGVVFGSWIVDFIIFAEYDPNLRPQVGLLTPYLVRNTLFSEDTYEESKYREIIKLVFQDYIYNGDDSVNEIDIKSKIDGIIDFESRLQEFAPKKRTIQLKEKLPRMKLQQLQQLYPNLPGKLGWKKLLSGIGIPADVLDSADFTVYNPSPIMFQQLDTLIAETEMSTLQNYALFIAWMHLAGVAQMHGFLVPGLFRPNLEIGWPLFTGTAELRKPNYRSILRRYKQKGYLEMNFAALNPRTAAKQNHSIISNQILTMIKLSDAYVKNIKASKGVKDVKGLLKFVRAMKNEDTSVPIEEQATYQAFVDGACIADTMEKFPLAIGRLYEHLIMKPQKIKIIADMFEEIRKTYRGRIVDPISEPWLDSISRAAAVEKLDFMQHAISLPQLARNPNFVSGFYQGINFTAFSSDSSMPGILQTVRFVNHSPYRFLKMDLSTVVLMTMQDWTEVNAFYVAELNTMIIPMGLWDSRLNAPSTIPAFNFGVIGAVIGHEITHGFDNNGIQFDKYGNSKPIMSDATAKSFLKNSRCFVSHFSEFSYRGIPTFGNQTLAENIADNGGIKVAYQAYSNSISEHSGQSSQLFGYRQLPGIDFLNYKQLFWIGNAQFWCSSISKIEAKLRQEKDEHAIAAVRVNAGLSLIDEFAKDWNCPSGRRMSPSLSCKLWRRNDAK